MAKVVNKDYICSTFVVAAIFECVTGDRISTSSVNQYESATVARYALTCPDCDIIVDMRKFNARPKGDAFDKFWAKMIELVDGRADDRRH